MTCVNIIMATCNGADHLFDQLQSIRAQTHGDWRLWVTDDGSQDETLEILGWFARDAGREVRLFDGPRGGATANFMSLVHHPELPPGPMAFCDQDDVWYPRKLEHALARVQGFGHEVPVLYAGRAHVGLRPDTITGSSRRFRRKPCFANALIQTIGGGNTMLLSQAAAELLRAAGPECRPAFHDWWCYLLVSGAGGTVLYDQTPMLFYRQHQRNLMGSNRGMSARRGRLVSILKGQYHHWVTRNLLALERCAPLLSEENRALLEGFRSLRRARGLEALNLWGSMGLYRQNRLETLLMASAAMMGRI